MVSCHSMWRLLYPIRLCGQREAHLKCDTVIGRVLVEESLGPWLRQPYLLLGSFGTTAKSSALIISLLPRSFQTTSTCYIDHEPLLNVDVPLRFPTSSSLFGGPSVSCSFYGALFSQHGKWAMLEKVNLVHTLMAGAVAYAQRCESYNYYTSIALLCLQIPCAAAT